MLLNNTQIITALEAIINKPGTTVEEKKALQEACNLIKKKGTAGYLEAFKWIRVALGLWDDLHDK